MTFATKTEALDALEETRAEWLASARAWAQQFARSGDPITITDVRRYGPPVPEGVDPRVCGAVFRDSNTWKPLGYVKSRRRTSHNRPVMAFALVV